MGELCTCQCESPIHQVDMWNSDTEKMIVIMAILLWDFTVRIPSQKIYISTIFNARMISAVVRFHCMIRQISARIVFQPHDPLWHVNYIGISACLLDDTIVCSYFSQMFERISKTMEYGLQNNDASNSMIDSIVTLCVWHTFKSKVVLIGKHIFQILINHNQLLSKLSNLEVNVSSTLRSIRVVTRHVFYKETTNIHNVYVSCWPNTLCFQKIYLT